MTSPSRKPGQKPGAAEGKPRKPGTFVSGDPRANTTKPGPGRPKDRFKKMCQTMVLKSTKKYVRRILRNPNHQYYMSALRWASEHGFGKPDAKIDVSGKMTIEQLVAASNQQEKK